MTDFTLPELGENITTGDVLRVLVKPGDVLALDQPVLEIETDKATVEVPTSVAGRVSEVKVKAGDKVKVGQAILSVDDGSGGPRSAALPAPAVPAAVEPAASPSEPPPAEPPPAADREAVHPEPGASASSQPQAAAAPSVRRLARELGVDVNEVAGSGPGGRISVEDVKEHAKRLVGGRRSSAAGAIEALPDFGRWGEIDRRPMSGVRRKTAEHVSAAWATIPHVTAHDSADITALDGLRHRYAKQVESAGGHLTVTAIALKVVAAALKVFPQFNASIDVAGNSIVFKKYVHIGIAVDTDRGLLVPVIRDVPAKNIIQLSVELGQVSEKARTGKLTLEEMQGGCFTISNLGGIGGTAFTPIVNAPEVAILGLSRARTEPVWRPASPEDGDGAFVPRTILPLSLSYDHRAIDGADGARFLRWVAEALEQPFLLALQG